MNDRVRNILHSLDTRKHNNEVKHVYLTLIRFSMVLLRTPPPHKSQHMSNKVKECAQDITQHRILPNAVFSKTQTTYAFMF